MEEGRGEPRVASAWPESVAPWSQVTVPLSPMHLPTLQPCPDSLRWAPHSIPPSSEHQHCRLWPGSQPHSSGAHAPLAEPSTSLRGEFSVMPPLEITVQTPAGLLSLALAGESRSVSCIELVSWWTWDGGQG